MRWLMSVAAAAITFGVCLWLAHSVSWGWLPEGEAERWGVAASFAAVAAGAMGAATNWWAVREPPARQPQGGRIVQARTTDSARIDQAVGHCGGPGGAVPDWVSLNAEASGNSRIRQTGGNDYTHRHGTA